MSSFNERLKQLRLNYYLNQSELAKRAGISKSLVSAYENAERYPSLDVLIKLADIFQCSTDYLLGLDSNRIFKVSGLTENQILLLANLIEEFKK